MTAERMNAKRRLDMHEDFISKLIYALDKQRQDTARELAELSQRIETLESRRWMVRLNDMVRKVWR